MFFDDASECPLFSRDKSLKTLTCVGVYVTFLFYSFLNNGRSQLAQGDLNDSNDCLSWLASRDSSD